MLDDQRMQCTSKLREVLSLPCNTQDESDKILMKAISVPSDEQMRACLAAFFRPASSCELRARQGRGRLGNCWPGGRFASAARIERGTERSGLVGVPVGILQT
jgi:hypothetical protein